MPSQMARILVACAAASVASCATSAPRLPGAPEAGVPARVRVQVAGRVVAVSLEQYVLGAALSEVTPTSESESAALTIYEVQAIIARTYAAANLGRHATEGFDLCDRTHCQLYQPSRIAASTFAAVARKAVVATSGRILRHRGEPAETLFHSDCGGRTTTPPDAWRGAALPYLPERADELPAGVHRSWQFSATSQEWAAILARDPRTNPGGPIRNLAITRTDTSGRAAEVTISGTEALRVPGSVLRTVVTAARGDRSVMSTRFVISRTANGYRLEGTGFGHGVGLCQVGAMARARRGDSLGEILGHYYPGTR